MQFLNFLSRAVLLVARANAASSKCYAMALSGGGDQGAYEAGVIQGLVDRLPPKERQWDVVTGISAGSIIASGMALFDKGDEVAMAAFLTNATTSFSQEDVFKQWRPLGVLTGLTKSGLLDTEPLYNTLVSTLGKKSGRGNRKIVVGATEDRTGGIVLFNESDWTSTEAWATRIRASSAIPGIFDSVQVDDFVLSDGGEVLGVNVFSAVTRCREQVESDEDIIVDIVTCDTDKLTSFNAQQDDLSLPLFMRGKKVKAFEQQMADVFDACHAYPKVNWRYFIQPQVALPSNGIQFNTTAMLEMVQIGKSEAAAAQEGIGCATAEAHRHSNVIKKSSSGTVFI